MSMPELSASSEEPNDRRRRRRNVTLKGYLIGDGGISHPIELVDLNYGGCGIRTERDLKAGETVRLTVLGRGSIPAEVRWYSDGRAGLDFTPSLKATRKQQPRRTSRVELVADIALRTRGRNTYRTRILDLSTDGCKVELVELPRVGESMSVKFDGLEALDADVCWVEKHEAGLMFRNRVHPAVLELLLLRLQARRS